VRAARTVTDTAFVTTTPSTTRLELSFDELALIYKSLLAVKTLGALPPDDELLDDTIQVVDRTLTESM
jgi:hypothetical protein